MPLNILLLLLGFVLLIKGADFFVDGASSISKKLKIPPVIIGLTVVALGTSCPEAAVSIQAAIAHSNAIAVSNVAGSNIFNVLVVIGVCTLFASIPVQKDLIRRDFPICILLSVMTFIFVLDKNVSRIEGIILTGCFIAYVLIMVISALKNKSESEDDIKEYSLVLSIIFLVGGIIAIVYGGDMVVDYASRIARALGMSDTLVGLTIVALGTSLPELVTSVVAIKKGIVDLAVGNVVGSNIFNLVFVLGSSAMISPITGLTGDVIADFLVVLASIVIAYIFCVKSKSFSRPKGVVLILSYVLYTAYIICRNYGFLGL